MHNGFGPALRSLWVARGLTQQGLADLLGSGVARSSIANVEAGREPPTPRLWSLIGDHAPDVAIALRSHYAEARTEAEHRAIEGAAHRRRASAQRLPRPVSHHTTSWLARPFAIEELRHVYVFRESRSPEEIIEVRRVRATEDGGGRLRTRAVARRADHVRRGCRGALGRADHR